MVVMKRRMIPGWLRRSAKRGGLSLMEAAASFLILGIASVGTIKTFALGRVGIESEFEYKMAAELLRQRTEYVAGRVHQELPDTWQAELQHGDLRGERVLIDRRGDGFRQVFGTIYFGDVEAYDNPATTNTTLDWYKIHTWITWNNPRQSVFQDGMAAPPIGGPERIDFFVNVLPTWVDEN
ncbi:MAG: hypothetical protein OEM52_03250 [bacterium]|nr:hypothetical protein [bacterium]